ncbi:MAG: aminotransferase class IV [Polyangiales bacterium]
MTALALVNGAPVDPAAPSISLLDRGFLYADGVFEVLRTYNGQPNALEDHLARLSRAATSLGIPLGAPNARWIAEVRQLLAASPWPECVVRLMLTRGPADPPRVTPSASAVPTRVVMAYPLPSLPDLDGRAVSVITLRGAVRSTPSTGHKTLEYLTSIWALREAARAGADDAILLDARGAVTEAASANVFVVSGEDLLTPPEGVALPGVTAQFVLEVARAEGMKVTRRAITQADLWTADEVFLTSSVREITPVSRIDEHEVPAVPGEVTRRLARAYGGFIRRR